MQVKDRVEAIVSKGWGHPGLTALAAELVAEFGDYPGHAFGMVFGDEYVIDPLLEDNFDPFDVPMEQGPAEIRDEDGKVIFVEHEAVFPRDWDATARQIVASKYFYGDHDQGFRETAAVQVVFRVTARITIWAMRNRTFATIGDAFRFFLYLAHIQMSQQFAFNSPVYFNVGVDCYGDHQNKENYYFDEFAFSPGVRPCSDSDEPRPQISACFIQSVEDNMQSIMALATSEAMLFKRGSGTGTDLTPLRASCEKLSGGGHPSGPVSFMRLYDAGAAIIKSGGKTRRAAKMQTLKYWHPDILKFIECKRKEERKARILIAAGYEANFNGEAYSSIAFQNANLSVRVDDPLMEMAESSGYFVTREVTTGKPVEKIHASMFIDVLADNAWDCGDPALQFETRIQEFHTVPNHGPINSSNPCSEYMHIDDSACNLGSVNVMRFRVEAVTDSVQVGDDTYEPYHNKAYFDWMMFERAATVATVAMETLVGAGSYPTEKIALNSHRFRPLGLGYANVGAYCMVSGYPYNSPEARIIVSAFSSLLTGTVYRTSAMLAYRFGAFDGFAADRHSMMRVIDLHREHAEQLGNVAFGQHASDPIDELLIHAAIDVWSKVHVLGSEHGFRNSQATCIAPTGTIAFMMGCDTLGIEPEIALVRFKALAGRGTLKLVNSSVATALANLGYSDATIENIINHIHRYNTIEDVRDGDNDDWKASIGSGLKAEHLPIFDCAFAPSPVTIDGNTWKPVEGRYINIDGHVDMMAAATPFISGAISKTANMPKESTPADIRRVYVDAWKKGCKSIAVYRDGSKESQVITTKAAKVGPVVTFTPDGGNPIEIQGVTDVSYDPSGDMSMDEPGDYDVVDREYSQESADMLQRHEADIAELEYHNKMNELKIAQLAKAREVEMMKLSAAEKQIQNMADANIRMQSDLAARTLEVSNLRGVLRSFEEGSEGPVGGNQRESRGGRHEAQGTPGDALPGRFRMPTDRSARIHKFNVAGHEGFIIQGLTDDGMLGEVFIEMSKQGSTVAGLMDVIGVLISVALQHRVPLAKIVEKLEHQKFNPAGITMNKDIKFCSSVVDYVGRYLGINYLPGYRDKMRPVRADGKTPAEPMGAGAVDDVPAPSVVAAVERSEAVRTAYEHEYQDWMIRNAHDIPDSVATGRDHPRRPGFAADINNDPCPACGAIMIRQGSCNQCFQCGFADGGCGG